MVDYHAVLHSNFTESVSVLLLEFNTKGSCSKSHDGCHAIYYSLSKSKN